MRNGLICRYQLLFSQLLVNVDSPSMALNQTLKDKAHVLSKQHSQCEHFHRQERPAEALRDHAQGGAAARL